jgi:hypothetical protein
MEVKTALQAKNNVVVVHDIKNCPFPDAKLLPKDVQPVLDEVTIPFYREQAFRETAMLEIAKAVELLPG